MNLWHHTADAKRAISFEDGAWWLHVEIGTSPVIAGQSVWVIYNVERADGSRVAAETRALWAGNKGRNSYWQARLGPFSVGDQVEYVPVAQPVHGKEETGRQLSVVILKLKLIDLGQQRSVALAAAG